MCPAKSSVLAANQDTFHPFSKDWPNSIVTSSLSIAPRIYRIFTSYMNSIHRAPSMTLGWPDKTFLQTGMKAEELRRNALQLETQMRRAESQSDTAKAERNEIHQQLEEARSRINSLEVKAKDCESIPELWRHIEESTKQIDQLKAAQQGLQVRGPAQLFRFLAGKVEQRVRRLHVSMQSIVYTLKLASSNRHHSRRQMKSLQSNGKKTGFQWQDNWIALSL